MGAYTGPGVSADHYLWQERVHHSLPAYLRDSKQVRSVYWEGETFRHAPVDVVDTSLIR